MKKVYWRPKSVSRTALLLIACFAVGGLILVEAFPVQTKRPYGEDKKNASRKALEAFEMIYYARQQTRVPIDTSADPTGSGLLGLPMSSVTSLAGTLEDKQSTINPNFAAVMVQLLRDAGVKKGDVVAVGVSGSFPALNIATYAALETIQAEPIVIASASSSQWGANIPGLLWLDMERVLNEEGVFKTKSIAASIGGHADRGLRFPEDGLAEIMESIERNQLTLLESKKFEESVEKRMKLYEEKADGRPIVAYVNVGGGMVSVGRTIGKKTFGSGLNEQLPAGANELDGVMVRFSKQGLPVIHIVNIQDLAEKYGLPLEPQSMPKVGDSAVFERFEYRMPLVLAVLLIEMFLLFAFIRSDVGSRLFRKSGKRRDRSAPEPMV